MCSIDFVRFEKNRYEYALYKLYNREEGRKKGEVRNLHPLDKDKIRLSHLPHRRLIRAIKFSLKLVAPFESDRSTRMLKEG